jgi:hypothetical protein
MAFQQNNRVVNEIFKFVDDGSGNPAIRTTLSGGDIQIGAVEIKDATSDNRQVVDASGNSSTNVATVESTIPTELSDGDKTDLMVDTFKRLILKGFNYSSDALDTNQVNQALLNTIEVTLLDAVTADGSSAPVDVSNFNKLTFAITSSSTTDGATVALEGSLDDTNWYTIDSNTVDTDTTTSYVISDEKHKYVRATISSRTDGTYTVDMIGGN